MSVKIGSAKSAPRAVPGGSPQGSILGNFLFCVTTNVFAELPSPEIDTEPPTTSDISNSSCDYSQSDVSSVKSDTIEADATSTPSARGQFIDFRPPTCLLDLSGNYQSEDGSFHFFRNRRRLSFDSSDEEHLERIQVPNSVCVEPISTFVYIDDFNTVEKIKIQDARSHITTNKREIVIKAAKSEAQFEKVRDLAESLNMRVNGKKTQILCIHANNDSKVTSYIGSEQGDINSTTSLKILGFNFGVEPNAVYHVTLLIEKFYRKLWSLRFLRKSGMKPR